MTAGAGYVQDIPSVLPGGEIPANQIAAVGCGIITKTFRIKTGGVVLIR